ncbi:unnamed protein product [Effrenium voratum]|nr:unnamed protein product [Effrenium voratum]
MTGWVNTAVASPANRTEEKSDAQERDPDEEPVAKLRAIAVGAGLAMVSYSTVDALVPGDSSIAEDVVDLAHSAYTSSVAIVGMSSLEPHAEHTVALPPRLSSGRGPVTKMFCHSIGYFLADVGLITAGALTGNLPPLWAGRLIHHVIQAGAVLPCIFRTTPSEALALRSVLCIAYFAEFSNIFLRLSNLLRRRAGSFRLRRAVNVALLCSFGVSRLGNFFFAVRVFWQAKRHIHPEIFKMLTGIQASGYMLNLAWFFKIVKIVMKSSSIPSIEC